MSKKIKTSERHLVYVSALFVMREFMRSSGNIMGLCSCIRTSIYGRIKDCEFVRRHKHLHIENYPELMEYKPANYESDGFWFPTDFYGYQARIQILESAIEKTKPT